MYIMLYADKFKKNLSQLRHQKGSKFRVRGGTIVFNNSIRN
jgi:hypothetical protein